MACSTSHDGIATCGAAVMRQLAARGAMPWSEVEAVVSNFSIGAVTVAEAIDALGPEVVFRSRVGRGPEYILKKEEHIRGLLARGVCP